MKPTYISLFSSAGVGCFGFKECGFDCIATNELIQRRLEIQKYNNKCKYDHGYILGDITSDDVLKRIFEEIEFWHKHENLMEVDVIVATPPCQGMSVANHKKSSNEIIRNSLVVESIKIIKKIKPKFFIFENVPSFCKTICTDIDGINKPIIDAITNNLGQNYKFRSQVLNFKNYGSNSSRSRTLVIGVRNDFIDFCTPIDFFPNYKKEKTLREVIGNLPSLKNMSDISKDDIYHFFRPYAERMRPWIHDLKEGESAFDNTDILKKPHQIINGKIRVNIQKNGDKYKRQFWDKVGPCIHTRNDQLASQNTIHPEDDRVFSIRELMLLMSIPNNFKWTNYSDEHLNSLSLEEKKEFLRKNEINIRQSIGEAVPTGVFKSIASKISNFLSKKNYSEKQIISLIDNQKLYENGNVINFVNENLKKINVSSLERIVELANAKRTETAAYYTDKKLIEIIYDKLPEISKDTIHILEPSVGAGNFLPYVLKKYENKKIKLDVIDIDNVSLDCLKKIIKTYSKNFDVTVTYINEDFLNYKTKKRYDLIIGNPPFSKINRFDLEKIKQSNSSSIICYDSNNLSSYFLEKSCSISDKVCMIMPKNLLNTPEFESTRAKINLFRINDIIDFGENGFKGVLVETIFLSIDTLDHPSLTNVISISKRLELVQKQSYICDSHYPYWIIYRNKSFDLFASGMIFNIFTVFRDRQITSANTHLKKLNDDIFVLKSRNISEDGTTILHINSYDSFISKKIALNLTTFKYFDRNDVYLTPNMTYKTRIMKKQKGYITNGSVAVLIPKEKSLELSETDLLYFSSDEYRNFLQIARNYQTRTLNIDNNSVYFFGKRKGR